MEIIENYVNHGIDVVFKVIDFNENDSEEGVAYIDHYQYLIHSNVDFDNVQTFTISTFEDMHKAPLLNINANMEVLK